MSVEELQETINTVKKNFNKLSHKADTLFSENSPAFKAHPPSYKKIIQSKTFQNDLQDSLNDYFVTIRILENALVKKTNDDDTSELRQRIDSLKKIVGGLEAQSRDKTAYKDDLKEIITRHKDEIGRLERNLKRLQA